jgi:hypothetical protein
MSLDMEDDAAICPASKAAAPDDADEPSGKAAGSTGRMEVLDRFLCQCRPLGFGRDCDGRPIDTHCHTVPAEREGIVCALTEAFGEDRLAASGIVERGEEGQWRLSPPLTPGAVLLPLREASDELPYEVLTPTGGLVGSDLPIVAVLQDHWIRSFIDNMGRRLLVCPSTAQIPPLMAHGLPATILDGLLDQSARDLRQMGRTLGWPEPSPHSPDRGTHEPLRLVLVDWDPVAARAMKSPQILRAARFLADTERHLKIGVSCCGVWVPDQAQLERYRFCRRVRDVEAAREALLQSMDYSTYAVSAYAEKGGCVRRKPQSFIEAYANLERRIEEADIGAARPDRLQEAEETFARFVESDLVRPLTNEYLQSDDPLTRNVGLAAAVTSRLLHRQAPYLAKDVLDLAQGRLPLENQKRVVQQLKQRARDVGSLIQLAKVLGK